MRSALWLALVLLLTRSTWATTTLCDDKFGRQSATTSPSVPGIANATNGGGGTYTSPATGADYTQGTGTSMTSNIALQGSVLTLFAKANSNYAKDTLLTDPAEACLYGHSRIVLTGPDTCRLKLRCSADGTTWVGIKGSGATGIQVVYCTGGTDATTTSLASATTATNPVNAAGSAGVPVVALDCWVEPPATSGNPDTIRATLYNVNSSGANTTVCFSIPATAIPTGLAGTCNTSGRFGWCTTSVYATEWIRENLATPLDALAPVFVSATTSTITVTPSVPTGGSGSYTQKLYRVQPYSQATGSATLVASSVTGGTAYTDTPPAAGLYGYFCVVSDGTNSYTTSRAATRTASTGPLALGWIGDSISAGTYTAAGTTYPSVFATQAQQTSGAQSVSLANMARPGSATTHWLPTSAIYATGTDSANLLTLAVNAFNAGGVTEVDVMLGMNDPANGGTPSVYQANLSTMAAYLFANVPTLKRVILHAPYPNEPGDPPPSQDWVTARGDTYAAYIAACQALDNGKTILVGDIQIPYLFLLNRSYYLSDLTHPTPAGAAALASLQFAGRQAAIARATAVKITPRRPQN